MRKLASTDVLSLRVLMRTTDASAGAADKVRSDLQAAVASGNFTAALISKANTNGVDVLKSVSVPQITFVDNTMAPSTVPTVTPTIAAGDDEDDRSTEAAVIAGVLVFMVIFYVVVTSKGTNGIHLPTAQQEAMADSNCSYDTIYIETSNDAGVVNETAQDHEELTNTGLNAAALAAAAPQLDVVAMEGHSDDNADSMA
mmetsp:Transcript_12225/g.20435  ORF Transcript_12225/g.20435 Transcript_12225/m.20435 type:complete len:199 (+) Transcript_12225:1445-2041(+)